MLMSGTNIKNKGQTIYRRQQKNKGQTIYRRQQGEEGVVKNDWLYFFGKNDP